METREYIVVSISIPKFLDWSAAKINITDWAGLYLLVIKLLVYTLSTNCIKCKIRALK